MKRSLLHGAFLFETRAKAVSCFGVSIETRYMTALKGILRVGRDVLLIALSTVALGEVGLRIYNSIDPLPIFYSEPQSIPGQAVCAVLEFSPQFQRLQRR
jgi:hypothetical protein